MVTCGSLTAQNYLEDSGYYDMSHEQSYPSYDQYVDMDYNCYGEPSCSPLDDTCCQDSYNPIPYMDNPYACWDPCCDTAQRVYVGPLYYHRRVDITIDPECTTNNVLGMENGNSKLRGDCWGINFGYEYRKLCCIYGRADFRWTQGTMHGCPRHTINDWLLEARIGYTFGECSPCGWSVSPYSGIGYYWLDRKFKFADFKAKYKTWYVPIGIYADVEIACDFTAGIDVSFMPFFDSKIDTSSGVFDIKDQGLSDRYMWRVSVPLRWTALCDYGFEISVEPFWEQLRFQKVCQVDSTVDASLSRPGVPRFREDLWGAKFLAGFKF